ncbi:MAG: hypothetical protein OHK0038_11720 [Flammeovirgaceae bacterium]
MEDLLENDLIELFEILVKKAIIHRSRILEKLAMEVAAPIIEKNSYEKGKQEGMEKGRQEGEYEKPSNLLAQVFRVVLVKRF